jgi:hemolysin activation/secretion protein
VVTDQREFEIKRFKARGNYLYANAGVERIQKLPFSWNLYLKLDGQVADQPLPSNEQYAAGGMASVRGYKETEELGDDAVHGVVELSAPELASLLDWEKYFEFTPFVFYDFAGLRIKDPLPEQESSFTLQGTGIGVRGFIWRYFEYELDWGVALSDTSRTESGDHRIHFRVKWEW